MITTIYCGEAAMGEAAPACNEERVKKLEKIFSKYLEEHKTLPETAKECEISLTFVHTEQMAQMNEEYREVSGPTDVLSFPMWENDDGAFEPPTDWETLTLGDIIVCPEIVARNAEENGKSAESETALVVCHGFLHLIGFDHAEEEERDRMWAAQEALVREYEDSLNG